MAGEIRYRTGINARTGKILTGPAHLAQSLSKIWQTRLDTRVMRLSFGADLRSALSEDLTPSIALLIYNEMVASAARWEPEYLITQLQLVTLQDTGKLGIRHGGIYYPEGRFGNYDLAVDLSLGSTTPTALGL
ncbi:MAG: integrase [Rhizobiales bacterium]|jgi:phage baseplate assembly protein W|nr:integrase [Hyphomicrobiales bacterium]